MTTTTITTATKNARIRVARAYGDLDCTLATSRNAAERIRAFDTLADFLGRIRADFEADIGYNAEQGRA